MKVKAVVENRLTSILWPYPEDLPDYFKFRVSGYRYMPAYRNGTWDGYICLLKNGQVPTGLFLAAKDKITEERGICWKISDQRRACKFRDLGELPAGIVPRDYQLQAVDAMIGASSCGAIVKNATGTGKTLIAGLFFRRLIGRAVFIVDELTLLHQAQEELQKILAENVGVIGEGRFAPARITVATVQTLALHSDKDEFEQWAQGLQVMVIDELHNCLNKRQWEVIEAFSTLAVYGLTATLEMDKEDVWYRAHAMCGPLVSEYKYSQGLREGHLAQGVVIAADMLRESSVVGIEQGSSAYRLAYEQDIVRSKKRNDAIADLCREAIRRGRHAVVLVERLDHLEEISDRLMDVPHQLVWGGKAAQSRIKAKQDFESGQIRLIITNKVFQKGIDIKRLDFFVDAASMKSANNAVQKFGRGVRKHESKLGLIYIDVGDRRRDRSKTNYFEKPTKARRKALKDLGVPIIECRLRDDPAKILDIAEQALRNETVLV